MLVRTVGFVRAVGPARPVRPFSRPGWCEQSAEVGLSGHRRAEEIVVPGPAFTVFMTGAANIGPDQVVWPFLAAFWPCSVRIFHAPGASPLSSRRAESLSVPRAA